MKVSSWLRANKLSLNIKKTQIIIFKAKNKKLHESIDVKLNNEKIKQVKSIKFLGINIDSNLTWKQHINYITKKVSKTTGILYKARHYVSPNILRTLYHALVYPYLHYGNIIWANTYPTRLDKIKKLQKKIIKIITFSNFTAVTAPLFSKLSVLTIDNIYNDAIAFSPQPPNYKNK